MKRIKSIFISMLLLAVSVAFVNAPVSSAMDYDKGYAEYVAVNCLANFNNGQYEQQIKYLPDDENMYELFGGEDNYKEIVSLYEERAEILDKLGVFQEIVGEPAFEEVFSDELGVEVVKVTLKARYESGMIDFTVPLASNGYSLTLTADEDIEINTAEEAEESRPMSEIMEEAGLNTLMGVGIVFGMLIVISFVISLFKFINRPEKKKDSPAPKAVQKAAPAAPAPVPVEDVTDDTEIVAVIMAAIMADMEASGGEVPADGLVVRSIRRRQRRAV